MNLWDCRDCGFECNSPEMYCLCLCPYCGKKNKNCRCNQNFKAKRKNFFQAKIRNDGSMNKINNSSAKNHIIEGWWRLEKWQVGRSKFA